MAIERLRFDEQPERLPPHNVEAEEAVLGSVLLDREVIGRVSGVLDARDFYRERNGLIYQAMLDLYDRHEPVDYLTLIDELDRTQRLDQTGGATYVAGLLGVVPTPIHAEHYAKIVADCAFMRRLISAGGKIATIGFQNQFEPETALEKSEQILFEIASKKANRDFAPLSDILRDYLEQLSLLREGEGDQVRRAVRLRGPRQAHGRRLPALRPRSSSRQGPAWGRRVLGLGIAANAALKFKAASAIFSLEMSAAQLAARLLSTESGIETTRLRTGNLTEAESRKLGHALGILAETQIYVDDTPGISVTSLRAKTRRLHAEVPLDLVIVDHLQLMTSGNSGMNRVQEMSEISRQLKGLARELHVPVVALSQLSRAVEQRSPKIPILSDLRESRVRSSKTPTS